MVDCAGHLSSSSKMLVFRGMVIANSGMSQEEVYERESAGQQEGKGSPVQCAHHSSNRLSRKGSLYAALFSAKS
jgi:hypothetical protein